MDENFKKAYKEYLKLPLATMAGENFDAEIYSKHWCQLTGLSYAHPHPHRHYTLLEFAFWSGRKQDLFDRFMVD